MAYTEYSFSDENAACSHSYLTKSVIELLDKEKNKKILDVGCGNGYLVRLLVENGFDAFGIDASESGINIAKKYYPDRFYLQDINSKILPMELQHINFDTIISTEVIEHLYDPKDYIEFCKDILNKNGKGILILTTPYHGYLKNLFISLSDKWDIHLDPLWDGGHIKFWSKKTLTKLLSDKGFKVTKFIGCGRLPWFWKSMLLKAEMIK